MNIDLQPISVIIVNYNAGELLLTCVTKALAQAQEVIVVDNNSSDFSMDGLATMFASEPRLKTQCMVKNLGFATGCNLGLMLASQANILFLNPDCLLSPDSLKHMLKVLQSDSTIGMVGGLLTNLDGSEQGGGRRAIPTPWRSFVRAFGLNHFNERWPKLFFDFHLNNEPLPLLPTEVEAISGALMLVNSSAIKDVGNWDEDYFLHCEDLDWCMRFRQNKWKILFDPEAVVLHHRGHCSRSRPFFVEWHKHKGMIRFYKKFFGHQYPGILMWIVKSGVWFRFAMVSSQHSLKLISNRCGEKRV